MDDRVLAVRAARFFDGEKIHEGPVLVLAAAGRFLDINLTGEAAPEGAELVDLRGCTLLPGFIDAHQHLTWNPSGNHEHLATEAVDALVVRAKRHAEQALWAGITTIRDLGDRGFATVRLRREWAGGPDLLVSGPAITPTGGHCWFLGGEANTEAEVLARVAERVNYETDWVKVMATGGFSTEGSDPFVPHYPQSTMTALVDAAHRNGLPVAAHAHAATGIAVAVSAGVDSVEHCTFHTEHGSVLDPHTVEAMAAQGIRAGVTVARPRPDRPPWIQDLVEQILPNALRLKAMGVSVTLCTDAGIIPDKTHDILPSDLVFAASRGFSNTQVLAAATTEAAALCGISGYAGRIAPGYKADFLAVEGNPLHHSGLQKRKSNQMVGSSVGNRSLLTASGVACLTAAAAL
jgi:imidazolonepropionase-like amidohydrolase